MNIFKSVLLGALIVAQTAVADSGEPADAPQWLALLHMRASLGGYQSEVDRADFFLSGRSNDPKAELQASLAAWSDEQFHCRYPARSQYLSRTFGLAPADFSHCTELKAFRAQFPDQGLTLVYPEPYLQDIAAIFGHSFLRVDGDSQQPKLLAPTISYYADVQQAGSVPAYIAKGLAGGFPGVFTVTPYFRNLRDYTVGEDRDIYEYTLRYEASEIRLLIDHLWEVNGASFNYFFLDENCSYRLIALLDAVAPPHRLRLQFTTHALPLDTVKVLDRHGRVAQMNYIPSARKRFETGLAQLDAVAREKLEREIAGQPQGLDPVRLDLAAQHRAIAMRQHPELRAQYGHEVQKLLLRQGLWSESKMSRLPEPAQAAAVDPAREAHGYRRLGAALSHADSAARLHLNLRPAYHDFLDPAHGFQSNVQLRVLELEVSAALEHGHDWQLERLTAFSLAHYQPQSAYFPASAWGVGIERSRLWLGENRFLVNRVGAYRGWAHACGIFVCHADLTAELVAGSGLDTGWSAAAGLRLGALYRHGSWRAKLALESRRYGEGEHLTLTQAQLAVSYQLARNAALVAELTPAWAAGQRREQYSLGVRWYLD